MHGPPSHHSCVCRNRALLVLSCSRAPLGVTGSIVEDCLSVKGPATRSFAHIGFADAKHTSFQTYLSWEVLSQSPHPELHQALTSLWRCNAARLPGQRDCGLGLQSAGPVRRQAGGPPQAAAVHGGAQCGCASVSSASSRGRGGHPCACARAGSLALRANVQSLFRE